MNFFGLLSIHYEFTRILGKTLRTQDLRLKAFVSLQNLQIAVVTTSRSLVLLIDSMMVNHLKPDMIPPSLALHPVLFFVHSYKWFFTYDIFVASNLPLKLYQFSDLKILLTSNHNLTNKPLLAPWGDWGQLAKHKLARWKITTPKS